LSALVVSMFAALMPSLASHYRSLAVVGRMTFGRRVAQRETQTMLRKHE
jgi:hypothetical protein